MYTQEVNSLCIYKCIYKGNVITLVKRERENAKECEREWEREREGEIHVYLYTDMGWLWIVGSIKL